jgi:hypothetical protein
LVPSNPGQRSPVHIEEEGREEDRGVGEKKEKNKAVITAADDIHMLLHQSPE